MISVSIIVPVYNVELYVEDCIRSVIRQTYDGPMECIIVDDRGADESMAVVEKAIADYAGPIRFEIVHHERNKGLSAARNTGICHAKGDYIYFLDSDDWITDDCIALLMGKVKEDPSIELVQGNAKTEPRLRSDGRTKKISIEQANNNDEVRECVTRYNQFPGYSWNKLVKRAFIEEHQLFFMEGVLYEDGLWRFYLLKYLSKVCFLPDITYIYRMRLNSITSGTNKYIKAIHRRIICHEFLANLTPGHEREEYNLYAKEFAGYYIILAHAFSGMREEFWLYWEKGKQYGKLTVRAYLAWSYLLGSSKLGWLLNSVLRRLRNPELLVMDFKRIVRNILVERNNRLINI